MGLSCARAGAKARARVPSNPLGGGGSRLRKACFLRQDARGAATRASQRFPDAPDAPKGAFKPCSGPIPRILTKIVKNRDKKVLEFPTPTPLVTIISIM